VEIAVVENRTVSGERLVVGWTCQPNQPIRIAAEDNASLAIRVPAEAFSHLIAGLSQLLRAFDYAADVGGDVWDLAVEISDLRAAGMTTSDFRWLVSKGFVQHGQETSVYGVPHRSIHCGTGLTFLPTSAFVLTALGAAELREWLPSTTGRGAEGEGSLLHLHPSSLRLPADLKPVWHSRSRELRVGEFLVKKFRVPAENQELILSVFEEECWPTYIDDPLPMKPEIVPKQRLNNVISRLNGRQLAPILRFHGNGNGEGIGWQLLAEHSAPKAGGDHGCTAARSNLAPVVSFDRNRSGSRSKRD
jgi:hypothetical protein